MDPLTYEIVLFESNSPISWIAAPPLKIYLHTSDKMDRGYELIDLFFPFTMKLDQPRIITWYDIPLFHHDDFQNLMFC